MHDAPQPAEDAARTATRPPATHPPETLERGRHLPIPGTLNVRDVGGYPARGGTTRWGTLLRSDSLHNLDDAGRAHLAQIGLRTVVDLREPRERDLWPSALDGLGVRVHQVPVLGGHPEFASFRPLDTTYRLFIDERGEAVSGAVAALAQPGALPALVHCAAGKDRTGVVIALTLAAVGVADDVIAEDYGLSRQYFTGPVAAEIRQKIIDSGATPTLADEIMDAPIEMILDALAHVRARYGSVPAYLSRHGLTDADLETLHTALVAPPE